MGFEFLRNKAQLIKLVILLTISAFLVSCETVGYYTQAARGQLAIMFGREDISDLSIAENCLSS
mgnify:CR=1 FL=1